MWPSLHLPSNSNWRQIGWRCSPTRSNSYGITLVILRIPKENANQERLWRIKFEIEQAIDLSRFTAVLSTLDNRRLDIRTVRCKSRKEFCGNHPGPCVLAGHKEKKGLWLEGADWVEFNDLLNDVLDKMNEEATIFSRPREIIRQLFIRKGGLRRTGYDSFVLTWEGRFAGAQAWLHDEEGVWEDYRGRKAPASTFPDGTPGIHSKLGYHHVG